MRSYIIPIASAMILLSSCSVYRSGQTPDDVYYSPARTQQNAEYVEARGDRDEGRRYNNRDSYSGYDDYATADDRWLMMRVRNRARWSVFDNYYSPFSYYSPYGYGFGGGFYPGISLGLGYGGYYDPFGFSYYNHFNNYWNWNSYYNPYYPNIIVVNPKTNPAGYNTLRNFNRGAYSNSTLNNNRNANRSSFRERFNNTNQNYRLGNTNRRTYNNSTLDRSSRGTYSNPSQDRPVRTYSPSNNSYSPRSSGGSSGSSGSSGGGGSRPTRR